MQSFDLIARILEDWQLKAVRSSASELLHASAQGLEAFACREAEGGVRLEIRIVPQVPRSRLSLWNVLHLNQFCFPFGQMYLSPERTLALGLSLPPEFQTADWLRTVLAHLVSVAQGWRKRLLADHGNLPFHEELLTPDPGLLPGADVRWSSNLAAVEADAGLFMLEHLLAESFGRQTLVRVSPSELAIALDFVTHLHVLSANRHALPDASVGWQVGLQTEIGYLGRLDAHVCVQLNRMNYGSNLLAAALVYSKRKHLLMLTSGLSLEFLQHPGLLSQAVQRHQSAAAQLFATLSSPYDLRSIAGFQLGF